MIVLSPGLDTDGNQSYLPSEVFKGGGKLMGTAGWPKRLARDVDEVEPRFAAMHDDFGVCVTCKLKPEHFEKQLFQVLMPDTYY